MPITEKSAVQPDYSFCIRLWGANLNPDDVTSISRINPTWQKVRGEVKQVEGRPQQIATIGSWQWRSAKFSSPELCIAQLEILLIEWCERVEGQFIPNVEESLCELIVSGNSDDGDGGILEMTFPQSVLKLVVAANFPLHVTYMN